MKIFQIRVQSIFIFSQLFILCINYLNLLGQSTEIMINPGKVKNNGLYTKIDTNYIKFYKDSWTIRPFLCYRLTDLTLEKTKQEVQYLPNMPLQVGLFIGYKRFGIGGTIAIPANSSSNDLYGKTDYFDMDLSIFTRKLVGEVGYAHYRGFRLQNYTQLGEPGRQIGNSDEIGFPLREDLKIRGGRANLFYVFNYRKYSLKSAFQQLEQQRRSAGSFLLMGSFNYQSIRADTSLVPFSLRDNWKDISEFKGGIFVSLAMSPGYGHSFKFGRFHFTGLIFLGPAIQFGRIRTTDEKPVALKGLGGKAQFRIAFGYDRPKFCVGLFYYFDTIKFDTPEIQMRPSTQMFVLYFGTRVNWFN